MWIRERLLVARCAARGCLERRCNLPEGLEFVGDEAMERALMAREDTALAHRLSFFVISRMVSEGWLTQCQEEYMVPESLLAGTLSWELLARVLHFDYRVEPVLIRCFLEICCRRYVDASVVVAWCWW